MKYAMLENAMDIIMSKTCVKFERIYPDETGELPPEGWVNITGNQNGCFSDLGRSPFAPSVLNLNVKKCFRIIGHAIHEILHTLGVYHEHMRPDRDDHITIIWENIRPGNQCNVYNRINRGN
ncbi:hypothetical protein DMN91_001116 [Ooceraea biroi]|uniref:Metalloendopeptidase n=1 Tax=Ooceraea biroi TaxID=2015173 RepID=A0A3L8E4H1_OOCBI|nr:astacin-like metalloprotease toxin 2 [Ooceraea biroi]RLU27315.1 hypothetical protein DMN91_001116 [Ooceraea biroi]